MEQIRHTYLHYEVEPARLLASYGHESPPAAARTVQDAPIDFNYKSDIVSFITECMIKAVEAHTMDVGLPKLVKPEGHERAGQERYTAEMVVYDRQAEAARHSAADLAMRQGWVLAGYFYDALNQMHGTAPA